jgi:hypothetical protein
VHDIGATATEMSMVSVVSSWPVLHKPLLSESPNKAEPQTLGSVSLAGEHQGSTDKSVLCSPYFLRVVPCNPRHSNTIVHVILIGGEA